MPREKGPEPLSLHCSDVLADQILSALCSLEERECRNRDQFGESSLHRLGEEKRELEELQRRFDELHGYIGAIPGILLSSIHNALMQNFTKRFFKMDESARCMYLTKGPFAFKYLQDMQRAYNDPSQDLDFGDPVAQHRHYIQLLTNVQRSTGRNRNLGPTTRDNHNLPMLKSFLNLILVKKTIHLDLKPLQNLSTLSEAVFDEFKATLSSKLPDLGSLLSINLSSANSKTCLPQCDNKILHLIGENCPNLQSLDVSFHRNVTGDGLKSLVPSNEHGGCVKLQRLLIFDTGVMEKEAAKVIGHLPELEYLGYKETGKVVKSLHRVLEQGKLKLTHIDNRGSKNRRLVVSSLRCRKSMIVAISELCPQVRNLKLRVADDDVASLSCLEKVESVELVYHVGDIRSPGDGTLFFLSVRGTQLTHVTLICQNMSGPMLLSIAESCPNLLQLWFRGNHFQYQPNFVAPTIHNYLTKLSILYLRVGEGERYIDTNFPTSLLYFLLRNAALTELILALRSEIVQDSTLIPLFQKINTQEFEKVLICVPGNNSMPGIINLTENFVNCVNIHCPNLKKLGNLLSWKVNPEYVDELECSIKECNWDLTIINKKMCLR